MSTERGGGEETLPPLSPATLTREYALYSIHPCIHIHICTLAWPLPPNLTNFTKITYLQALIDSSKPTKLKKCNETPKKFAWTLNFAH